jgi:protoporphyrinogen oxidase
MTERNPIVVLGAGPAGMAAAWRLSEKGFPVTVLEKDSTVGGMARTIKVGNYAVDFGPHTFHIRETDESRRIIEAIKPFFGPDPLILTRGTRVLLGGKFYVYPLELVQVMRGVPLRLAARILVDYAVATARYAFAPAQEEHSFEEWGVRNLGRTLYDLCFGIYSERVWGLPASQISSKQAQRVAKLNLKSIILRTLGIKADPTAYFTKYMYPRAGISTLYGGMATRAREKGACILLDSPAVRLERTGNRISRVEWRTDGRVNSVECEGVISTLPLQALVSMIAPALPDEVVYHASKLRYRSMRLIYIVLNRERLTDFHWVYLSDKRFRCNRISEQKNVSPSMIPADQTVLCIEFSCWRDDPEWSAPDEALFEIAMHDLQLTGLGVTRAEVASYFVHDLETAYPVYELEFEQHLRAVLEGVHSLDNLLTLGRHGLFLNNSMDDNVLLGMKVADQIAERGMQNESRVWLAEMLDFMHLRFQGK